MNLSRKEKKFITFLFIAWLLVMTEYSVYAFDPIVPQERLNDVVQIGTITPLQFEELDKATMESILERKDVQSLLRNHFELLGMYGETTAGLLLRTPEDWARFGKEVGLNGATFQRIYDYWYQERGNRQQELLTGDAKKMEAFFETHFSSTEENRLTDGRLMGADIDWSTFAYERGLPITAGLLFILYQAWWRKKKEEPLEDWGGLENIYSEAFEKNNRNYEAFYTALKSDNRIYGYPDWYQRMWAFWKKAKAKLENKTKFETGTQELVSLVKNYVFERKSRQKREFEASFQEVLIKLSSEEIESMSKGEFVFEEMPVFLEATEIDLISSSATEKLMNGWGQFAHQFLEEKELMNFLKKELAPIKNQLKNHPEKLQGILTTTRANWFLEFEKEKQEEVAQIYAEADAWYAKNIQYAVYNYQYRNVERARGERIQKNLENLENILKPQKESLNKVFNVFVDISLKEKKEFDEKIKDSTYRKELFEDIDYITPIDKLFPYEEPPTPPSKKTIERTVQEMHEFYPPIFEQEQKIDYLMVSLVAAKKLFDVTIGAQKKECEALVKSIERKIVNGGKNLLELEKKMDPTKNIFLAHSEVYAEEINKSFEKILRQLESEHKKMVQEVKEYWTPYLKDQNYWMRIRAQQNMDGSVAYYEKKYKETRKTINNYRAGKLLKKVACTGKTKEQKRNNFNNKQKQNRINYAQKKQENPAKKRVIQYLMSLEDAGKNAFFQAQKSILLHLETIQKAKESLLRKLANPSPYEIEIKKRETELQTSNRYTFEEYVKQNNIRNASWVLKDDWLRSQKRIGRHGDYWGQKYARYAHSLMANFSPYDARAIATLRELAQKAHQERMKSYTGWQKFYKTHPLQHEENYNTLKTQLSALRGTKAERRHLLEEQIETLDQQVRSQSEMAFASAQWLAKTPEERGKDSFTDIVLDAEMKSSSIDSETLLQHFSDVRENQVVTQQIYLDIIGNQKTKNPFSLDVEALLAPIIRQMHLNITPEWIDKKTKYFDDITGTTKSEFVIPLPPLYQKNKNGTYTPVERTTGKVITKSTLKTPVETFPSTEVSEPITKEIRATKKEEILNLGRVKEFQGETQLSLRKLLSVGSPLKFGLGVLDGVKSEIKGFLSLLNPLTWIEIAKVATKLHQLKQQLILSILTDPEGLAEHMKSVLPGVIPAMDKTWEGVQSSIANADDKEKGAILATVVLSFIPLGKLGKASKLTAWVDDIARALGNFVPRPRLAGVTVGGKTVILDDVVRGGGKIVSGATKLQEIIMKTDLRGARINGKITIPENWIRKATTGDGYMYLDPLNLKNNIRLMKEGNNPLVFNYQQPYFRIEKNGNYVDINGNISSDLDVTHIIINSIEL